MPERKVGDRYERFSNNEGSWERKTHPGPVQPWTPKRLARYVEKVHRLGIRLKIEFPK